MSTWILLRGLTRESRHWGRFPELLREKFLDTCVIAIDLPGSGEHNAMTSPLSIGEMAEQCRNDLVSRAVPPPYRLLAMSMGGMVATAWAQKYPVEIDACVLVNTSFTAFNPFYERLRVSAWPALLQLLLARNPYAQERLVFDLTSRLSPAPPTLLREWVAIRQSRPVRLCNALRQLFAAARFRAPTSAPALTLILASDADGLVNSRCSSEIAHRWNTAIAYHPTGGHDLPLDDGEWVIQEICAWLSVTSLRH